MIYSMTGYATVTHNYFGQGLSVDLRAVNSRYLELHFWISDEIRGVEAMLRERLSQRLTRGKIDCRVVLSASGETNTGMQLNMSLLEQLSDLTQQIGARIADVTPLQMIDVLRWPGMLQSGPEAQAWQQPCLSLLDQAMEALLVNREREGEKLAALIVQRLDAMCMQIDQLKPHLPAFIADYRQKLIQRFRELTGNASDERIPQEVALFAQKMDVDEELSRLQVHMEAVREIIQKGGVVGKKLDFLMQELNREANTLGSKSVSVEITQVAMALKVLIEQMREQVQNLE